MEMKKPHPYDEAIKFARSTVGEPRWEPWQAGGAIAAIALAAVSLFKLLAGIADGRLVTATAFACLAPGGIAYAYFWIRHREYLSVVNAEYERLKRIESPTIEL